MVGSECACPPISFSIAAENVDDAPYVSQYASENCWRPLVTFRLGVKYSMNRYDMNVVFPCTVSFNCTLSYGSEREFSATLKLLLNTIFLTWSNFSYNRPAVIDLAKDTLAVFASMTVDDAAYIIDSFNSFNTLRAQRCC